MSGGAVAALAAIVVVALLATGVGVFLVTRDGGGTATPSTPTSPVATTVPGAPGTELTLPSVPTDPSSPTTDPDASATTDDPLGGLGEGLVPGGSGIPGNVPEQLPRPEGATDGAVGLEVDLPLDAVATFYEGALPPEGYTVTAAESPLEGRALAVEGNGLTGQLLIANLGGPEASILWIPT